MRRLLDVRIRRWELKLAYVVVALLGAFVIANILSAAGLPDLLVPFIVTVFDFAAILYGARVFRGQGEPIEPPRAWWRMTARPRLSWVLGTTFIVYSLLLALGQMLDTLGVTGRPFTPDWIVINLLGIAEFAAFGALYLNSAIRLRRMGVPPKEPKFRPAVRIRS